MDKQKSIEALQFFVTNLNAQSFQHKLQAKFSVPSATRNLRPNI